MFRELDFSRDKLKKLNNSCYRNAWSVLKRQSYCGYCGSLKKKVVQKVVTSLLKCDTVMNHDMSCTECHKSMSK